MEDQFGIYCSKTEWLGVMMAVSKGMVEIAKLASDSEDAAAEMQVAHAGSGAFMGRVMRELGIMDGFKAYAAGDMDGAKKALEAFERV